MLRAVTVLNRMVRVGLIEKVILERRLESSKETGRKDLGNLRKSKSKGSVA